VIGNHQPINPYNRSTSHTTYYQPLHFNSQCIGTLSILTLGVNDIVIIADMYRDNMDLT
jgi:hypothetical protein